MTGTPDGSTESGFMEKPGIEPATPGLQGIALIHYTTGASLTCDVRLLVLKVREPNNADHVITHLGYHLDFAISTIILYDQDRPALQVKRLTG